MFNHITLIGRLTRDPEVSTTQSGIRCAKFRLAVDRNRRGPDGQKETDFFPVVAWRQQADFVDAYVRKGRMVLVDGQIHLREIEAQDGSGTRRTFIDVVANEVRPLDRPRDDEGGGAGGSGGGGGGGYDGGNRRPAAPQADEESDPFADE